MLSRMATAGLGNSDTGCGNSVHDACKRDGLVLDLEGEWENKLNKKKSGKVLPKNTHDGRCGMQVTTKTYGRHLRDIGQKSSHMHHQTGIPPKLLGRHRMIPSFS